MLNPWHCHQKAVLSNSCFCGAVFPNWMQNLTHTHCFLKSAISRYRTEHAHSAKQLLRINARVYGCKPRTESLDRDTPSSSDTKLWFLLFLDLEASSQFLDAPFLHTHFSTDAWHLLLMVFFLYAAVVKWSEFTQSMDIKKAVVFYLNFSLVG